MLIIFATKRFPFALLYSFLLLGPLLLIFIAVPLPPSVRLGLRSFTPDSKQFLSLTRSRLCVILSNYSKTNERNTDHTLSRHRFTFLSLLDFNFSCSKSNRMKSETVACLCLGLLLLSSSQAFSTTYEWIHRDVNKCSAPQMSREGGHVVM